MTTKITLSLAAISGLLPLAMAAQAQATFSIGPQLGLNMAGISNTTIHYRAGFEAGLQGVVQRGHLAVQPSLRFSQKGLDERYGSGLYSRNTLYCLSYLTLPVSIAYSLCPDGQGLQAFAGPYVGLLLGGSYQATSTDRGPGGGTSQYEGNIEPGDTPAPIPAPSTTAQQWPRCRQFDLGVQAGLGHRYGRLLAQAGSLSV